MQLNLQILVTVHMYRGADKSLARPGRKEARNHVRDARDFNNIETQAVIKLFFLQGKTPKEILAILTEILACFLPGRAKDFSVSLHTLRVTMDTVAREKADIQLRGSAVSLSSSATTQKAKVNLSTGDFTQALDGVKALVAFHVTLSWQISCPHERGLRILARSLRVATSPLFVLVPFMLSVLFEGPIRLEQLVRVLPFKSFLV